MQFQIISAQFKVSNICELETYDTRKNILPMNSRNVAVLESVQLIFLRFPQIFSVGFIVLVI